MSAYSYATKLCNHRHRSGVQGAMTYRNDLEALSARQAALETEVRDRQRELAEARRLVEEIEARARLPVLDNIRVAAPCGMPWDKMAGDDRVRACGDCQKNVYNLSDLTRDEAEALIVEKEGRLCVRYFQRADGTILLKDCAVGVKQRRRRRFVAVGVAASLAGTALAYVRPGGTSAPRVQAAVAQAVARVQVTQAAGEAAAAAAALAELRERMEAQDGVYVQGVMLVSTANEQAERLREQLEQLKQLKQLRQRERERSEPHVLRERHDREMGEAIRAADRSTTPGSVEATVEPPPPPRRAR
jgi:hypothetical protein